MRIQPTLVVLSAIVLVASPASSQGRREPMTDAEMGQLRRVAGEPEKRLRLVAKFAEARLDSIDRARGDPRHANGRGKYIHHLLEDFTAILDEINDYLDLYEGRSLNGDDRRDFRKGLKVVMSAEDGFSARLRTLHHDMETDPQTKTESRDYIFVLQDAEEAVKSGSDMAREYSAQKNQ